MQCSREKNSKRTSVTISLCLSKPWADGSFLNQFTYTDGVHKHYIWSWVKWFIRKHFISLWCQSGSVMSDNCSLISCLGTKYPWIFDPFKSPPTLSTSTLSIFLIPIIIKYVTYFLLEKEAVCALGVVRVSNVNDYGTKMGLFFKPINLGFMEILKN